MLAMTMAVGGPRPTVRRSDLGRVCRSDCDGSITSGTIGDGLLFAAVYSPGGPLSHDPANFGPAGRYFVQKRSDGFQLSDGQERTKLQVSCSQSFRWNRRPNLRYFSATGPVR